MLYCSTPHCSAEEFWCYYCHVKVSECDCKANNSTCWCDNKENWMTIGDHKSDYISGLRSKLWGCSEEEKLRLRESLAEAKLIGTYPPVLGSALDPRRRISVQGNNDGDYLLIEERGDGMVALEVGHCCVVCISHLVPVELITAALTEMLDYEYTQGWPSDFEEKLRGQVRKLERWERPLRWKS